MTFFQRATTTATTIGKKFIATLGSMAAMWAISEVISLAIKGIDRLANAEKYAEERLNKLKEKGEEAAKAIDELNDKFKSHTEILMHIVYYNNTKTNMTVAKDLTLCYFFRCTLGQMYLH